MDAFKKVRPGEQLQVAAQAWNRIVDQVTVKPRFDSDSDGYPPTSVQVRCQNATSGPVERWSVLQITGVLETPTGAGLAWYATGPTGAARRANDTFFSYPCVVGVLANSDAGSRFVVTTEPITNGNVGMAAIDGVVQVRLNVQSLDDAYAFPDPDYPTRLKTGSQGGATILWKAPATGIQWGLVRLGAGSGGGVKVGKITGTWAKNATQTVWEYTGSGSQATGASGPPSVTGINRFAQVNASGGAAKWVAVASIDSRWHLIAAECG